MTSARAGRRRPSLPSGAPARPANTRGSRRSWPPSGARARGAAPSGDAPRGERLAQVLFDPARKIRDTSQRCAKVVAGDVGRTGPAPSLVFLSRRAITASSAARWAISSSDSFRSVMSKCETTAPGRRAAASTPPASGVTVSRNQRRWAAEWQGYSRRNSSRRPANTSSIPCAIAGLPRLGAGGAAADGQVVRAGAARGQAGRSPAVLPGEPVPRGVRGDDRSLGAEDGDVGGDGGEHGPVQPLPPAAAPARDVRPIARRPYRRLYSARPPRRARVPGRPAPGIMPPESDGCLVALAVFKTAVASFHGTR